MRLMEQPAPPHPRTYSVDDYFRLEAESSDKHEFRNGKIVCMAGGSLNHSLIIANAIGEIRNRLKGGPCRVYDSNARVRIARRTLYSYPDVTVVYGETLTDPDDHRGETIINPQVVIEVLSPSTELYDRTKKFERFRAIESFQEYVLLSQYEPQAETFYRAPGGVWAISPLVAGMDSSVMLRSLDLTIPLAEIYAGVRFAVNPVKPPPEDQQ